MKKKYILPTTAVLMLQASPVLNNVSKLTVNPNPDDEGDQSEAESRSLRHHSVWDDV